MLSNINLIIIVDNVPLPANKNSKLILLLLIRQKKNGIENNPVVKKGLSVFFEVVVKFLD